MLVIDRSNSFNFMDEVNPVVRDKIADLVEVKRVEPGEWLFEQDDFAEYIYMIKKGKISLIMRFRDSLEDKLPSYGKGDIIGWSALVPPHIYTMGALAEEETILVGFKGERLLEVMEEDKEAGYYIYRNISQVIGNRLVSVCTQLMSLRV